MLNKFLNTKAIPKAAIFMSGNGSNAEKILEFIQAENAGWKPKVIVTDRPEQSRAVEIAQCFQLPVIKHDIKAFYQQHGMTKVSLKDEAGREIREKWTHKLRELLKPYQIDFGILAGFIPLSNITSDFPCLNVHPGDLTVEKDGKRILIGLHTIPIERAIYDGLDSLRSSVIIAQTYTGSGGEMDSGPILGISTPVKIDLMGYSLEELKKIYENRPAQRPIGGFKDELESVAKHNQELLKQGGDWTVFPPAIANFAQGNYAMNEEGKLHFNDNDEWKIIKTIEYGKSSYSIIEA